MKHDHKADFVSELGKNLRENSREEIFGLTYDSYPNGDEVVTILYNNGRRKPLSVTGDSCVGILKDVSKALM